MFTGIVQGVGQVASIDDQPGLRRFEFALDRRLTGGLEIGASVAVDGVCLTVTAFSGGSVQFDVMRQTLDTTTLGTLKDGDCVNIERSARYGDEVGGHVVSGHIDATASIIAIDESENNREIDYRVDSALMPFILPRGFIAINGCSLTVATIDREANTFRVCLIPETLRATTHGDKRPGDKLNVELDRQTQAIVTTVQSYLNDNRDWLQSLLPK